LGPGTGAVIYIDIIQITVYYIAPGGPPPGGTATIEAINRSYEIPNPVLLGRPLAFFWGPYGEGQTALFGFACGDPLNAGTLYITKGNAFDSTSDAYQIDITSPSEPLVNGCMFGVQSFVFSTKHDFMLLPSFDGVNLFEALQVAEGDTAGLYAPWGLAVGARIYKIVKDGIVASAGGEPESITNADLYPLFPHDGNPGVAVNGYQPPDMTQVSRLRLCAYDGMLYFDYVALNGANCTLVYDEKTGAWSEDIYTPPAIMHYGEDGPAPLA
jgi:hypothetical protein